MLRALALMCAQYIGEGEWVDYECIGAGEEGVEVLVKHGMMGPSGRDEAQARKGRTAGTYRHRGLMVA